MRALAAWRESAMSPGRFARARGLSSERLWRWEGGLGRGGRSDGVVGSADDAHRRGDGGGASGGTVADALFACLRALFLDPEPSWRHCSLALHIEGDAMAFEGIAL